MFPQLPVQRSTECTRAYTLNYDPFFIFDGTCHKIKSQTNRHPSINYHSRRRKPLPPTIILLSTCLLTPSVHSFSVIDQRCDKAVPHWALIRPRFSAHLSAPVWRPLLSTRTAHKRHGYQTLGLLSLQRRHLLFLY